MQLRVDKTQREYGVYVLDELLHIIGIKPQDAVHMIRHTIKWYYGIRLDVYCGYKRGIDGCFECYVKDTSIPYKFCLTAEHYKTKKGYDRVSIIDGALKFTK